MVQASEDSPALLPATVTSFGGGNAYPSASVRTFQRALNALKAARGPVNSLGVALPVFMELVSMPLAPVSGIVDPATVASIKAFQTAEKLTVNAFAGHEVFKKMDAMLFMVGL